MLIPRLIGGCQVKIMRFLRHNAAKGRDDSVFLLGGNDETFYNFGVNL